jgi:hypothetical protein
VVHVEVDHITDPAHDAASVAFQFPLIDDRVGDRSIDIGPVICIPTTKRTADCQGAVLVGLLDDCDKAFDNVCLKRGGAAEARQPRRRV